jgi:hypothetical protein
MFCTCLCFVKAVSEIVRAWCKGWGTAWCRTKENMLFVATQLWLVAHLGLSDRGVEKRRHILLNASLGEKDG